MSREEQSVILMRHDATNKAGCAASGGKNARSALRLHGVNFSARFCFGWPGRCFCSANTTSLEYGHEDSESEHLFYGVFGFIFGVISAAIYNLIARWIGGIEVEVE